MSDTWLEQLNDEERRATRKAGMPAWTAPMLATLTDDHFSSPDWVYERKLDGERALVFRDGRGSRLLSRNRKKLNDTYPELVDALQDQPAKRFIADGEIVAFDGKLTSFSRLQGRLGIRDPNAARKTGIAVYFYLFDLLYLEDRLVDKLPLRTRKRLLRQALRFRDPLRYAAHRNEKGEQYYREACKKGWEGVIAKRAEAPYAHKRSRDWLKFKCVNRQELVIGGYTEPQGSRKAFGALLLGYYERGNFIYAGRVGTGFDDALLEKLGKRLQKIETEACPFENKPASSSKVHWVRPELVAEIGFTEWTREGRLRHPRFLGLRRDKPARKVVREKPQ